MSSRVIKIQVCDRCGAEARAGSVTELPPGWSRLTTYAAGNIISANLDLCSICTARVNESTSEKVVTAT